MADLAFVGFLAFEGYEVVATIKDVDANKRKAQQEFATCLINCANKYKDYEGAHEFWDIFK